jgi:aspartyl-tRNA(Asn)/glutamyl-tRNA(Gln) amidotransferase subunit C
MTIGEKEVLHVAKLARLSLSDEEIQALARDMQDIISYADALGNLDAEGVAPTAHAFPMQNAFREDEIRPSYDRDLLLENAPAQSHGGFLVPKVVE